ncbi:MAG: phage/plasmid primase, P4 family [Eubacterium coprostanoligenes]|uniref:phage/plasmid primase, P4 family n=1 Tax=Eubacterium coprostanoligenes TaxID=290054 RepID=UPI002409ED4B|nr:phage/plasmid primase, P4 family [Eubacterium coprostanoligenes]MDD6666212.1 phage/plasmid primase, P4 family [Eubacterium coprostanoligenes]
MNLYKGYVPTKDKKSTMPFKGKTAKDLMTLEQVKDLPEYAGVLNDNTILIDVDDDEQAELLMQIVEEQQLDCKVICTSRGKHFLFRNDAVQQCYTHVKVAIGLTVDVKVGSKTSYEVLKANNEERFVEWDIEEGGKYQTLPKWLTPVKTDIDFLNMEAGDGRNSALFSYELVLQGAGLTKEESKEAIRIINSHILKEPLSDDELEVVLRDEAFAKPVFYHGKTFLHNVFGDYLIREHHIVKIDGKLHVYQDGTYHHDVTSIEKAMVKVIPTLPDTKRKEVLKYLNVMCVNAVSAPPNLIAFRNGILNIDTDELLPFSPEHVITNKIPWDYNPKAYDADADSVLNKISCNDSDIRALLEECIGYCFYRNNVSQKAFILIGEKSNGKSTFISVLNRILGDDNVSAMDLKNLGDRFSKATLFKKLANIGDDISDEFIPDASLFKKIVSGDRIQAECKGQDPFEFNPYVKLIFSANNMPRIRDKTGAVIRRLVIIPFNAVFSEDDADFDPDIKQKLFRQSAMEYFIKIGVESLKRVLEQKHFTKSTKVQKELEDYEEFNNPVIGFFKDMDEGYMFREDTKTIHLAYSSWCNENGYSPESKNQFGRTLKSLYGVESKQKTIAGKSVRMYVKTSE